jgi:hypothetical protein
MKRKIFITYKFGDESVFPLERVSWPEKTRVRDYVSELQEILADDHINKGELDGQDLSEFKDSTIASKLRDKIYDSSVTIVFISKNMKNPYKPEDDQWIPWEIAYSLREATRNDRTSRTNAMLAVVIPDEDNQYSYFYHKQDCCDESCTILQTSTLFQILRNNMFNIKDSDTYTCQNLPGSTLRRGNPSYIHVVVWDEFLKTRLPYWAFCYNQPTYQ